MPTGAIGCLTWRLRCRLRPTYASRTRAVGRLHDPRASKACGLRRRGDRERRRARRARRGLARARAALACGSGFPELTPICASGRAISFRADSGHVRLHVAVVRKNGRPVLILPLVDLRACRFFGWRASPAIRSRSSPRSSRSGARYARRVRGRAAIGEASRRRRDRSPPGARRFAAARPRVEHHLRPPSGRQSSALRRSFRLRRPCRVPAKPLEEDAARAGQSAKSSGPRRRQSSSSCSTAARKRARRSPRRSTSSGSGLSSAATCRAPSSIRRRANACSTSPGARQAALSCCALSSTASRRRSASASSIGGTHFAYMSAYDAALRRRSPRASC